MSLFSEFEKTIERGFKRWTERVFGPGSADQLVLIHRGILAEIESKVETLARGRRVFPYSHIIVTLVSPEPERRAVYEAAFAQDDRLEKDIREALESAGCPPPPGFRAEVRTAEGGPRPFEIAYPVEQGVRPAQAIPIDTLSGIPTPSPLPPARIEIVRGEASQAEYRLSARRTNIGRLAELTDSEHRVVRRNDVVFEEREGVNSTVSRGHAHIRLERGEYRICDGGSEFGTRIFRDGRSIEVPVGNRRGEKLRPGDEIYLGRACIRFLR